MMIAAFPKYESYQNTGEDWLGEIPQHWQLLRTKNIFRLIVEAAPKNNDIELLSVYSDIGVKPRRELEQRGNKASTTDGYWVVKKGDVIVNKLLAWMGAIGVSDYDGVTSPAYDILRAYKPIDGKFYHYLFRNPICISKLKQHSKGIMEMRLRLYFDEFGNIKIPYPPLKEQKRIVEFLDRTTTDIDRAIAQKQRLIELLQEQKAIVINQAVTKGLNLNVPMCDSGVEWLGKIPEHWSAVKLRSITNKIGDGIHSTPKYVSESEYYFINGNNLNQGKIVTTESTRCVSQKEVKKYKLELDENTVLISINGTIGNFAFYQNEAIILGKSAAYIMCKQEIDKYFLCYFLQSSTVRRYFLNEVTGSTIYNLSLRSLRNTLVPIPPIKEQIAIVSFLNNALGYIAGIEKNIQNSIDGIKEYRNILISKAVTGKIKV